ncbi:MAG: PepSY-associated TM helix domain-containing protein [Flammeovirgaceae bacterium]|nr:PepSY-associated TM helix domain-containing protein [Flammeovirgaceae bacterium]
MKLNARNIHRDLAYFYLGLIISFSFSGIFLNHRRVWHPIKYQYSTEEVTVKIPGNTADINDKFIENVTVMLNIKDKLKRYGVNEDMLKISYNDTDVEINLANGEGKVGRFMQTPVLGQMTQLHITTDQWWIYYSDIFGAAMFTIAITGMFISKGQSSFKNRGWKLAAVGIIFPLIFLIALA